MSDPIYNGRRQGISGAGYGETGQILESQGPGLPPLWADASASAVSGWGLYTGTTFITSNRLAISAGVKTKLPNDAGSTIETYLPIGVTSLYNGTTQKVTPSTIGDSYIVRVNFSSASGTVDNFANLQLDIPGGDTVFQRVISYPRGTTDQAYSVTSSFFALSSFVANGGEVYITPDDAVTIWGVSYLIERVSKGP